MTISRNILRLDDRPFLFCCPQKTQLSMWLLQLPGPRKTGDGPRRLEGLSSGQSIRAKVSRRNACMFTPVSFNLCNDSEGTPNNVATDRSFRIMGKMQRLWIAIADLRAFGTALRRSSASHAPGISRIEWPTASSSFTECWNAVYHLRASLGIYFY